MGVMEIWVCTCFIIILLIIIICTANWKPKNFTYNDPAPQRPPIWREKPNSYSWNTWWWERRERTHTSKEKHQHTPHPPMTIYIYNWVKLGSICDLSRGFISVPSHIDWERKPSLSVRVRLKISATYPHWKGKKEQRERWGF